MSFGKSTGGNTTGGDDKSNPQEAKSTLKTKAESLFLEQTAKTDSELTVKKLAKEAKIVSGNESKDKKSFLAIDRDKGI